ncbi:transducin beta-like protein 3 [Elgaria multicarinata webbii]|uniref:transducin beta-like protein 3 n=1 Tax=Elgaria multicarinata webbii TaxID=159646 RepID=UPI002FCD093C
MATPSSSTNFKTNYSVYRTIEPFYKGGAIQISQDGEYMFCACGSKVSIVDIASGDLVHSIEQDDESEITAFALSDDDEVLVTASQALLLKQWDWPANKCTRTWKAVHTAPVASMVFDSSSTLLATGGCDSTIKVWDIPRQYCTHNLKGSSGVVHLVQFHPDISQSQLFSSSMDNSIRLWDLNTSQCVAQLENHFSSVTSLAFSPDNETLISSGRDKICTVWDLKTRTPKGTISVYESIESVVLLPEEGDFSNVGVKRSGAHFLTAGSKGILRVWDASSAACVHSQLEPHFPASFRVEDESGLRSLVHCALVPTKSQILAVNADRNICLYDAQTLELRKQFSGYNGEVLDVRFLGPKDTHIVVATNSPQLKVFELASSNCQILYGHSDIVLALDVFRKGRLFASSAKDKTFRIWLMPYDGPVFCVAKGLGHSHAVGALACSRMKETFVVTASQDLTIKVWNLPESLVFKERSANRNPGNINSSNANPVPGNPASGNAGAPNPGAGSPANGNAGAQKPGAGTPANGNAGILKQGAGTPANGNPPAQAPTNGKPGNGKPDKVEILQPHVTEKAHDKDINSVAVSPNDKLIATGSQDKTAKLWTSQDCVLLGVFQGHRRGIWCVQFSPVDQVLATSSADGTVKIWDLQDFSCLKTFEGHDSSVLKIIFVSQGGQVLSSGSDGLLKLWTIKNSECVKTLDGHDDKVWGLDSNRKDNVVVTGSSDSRVLLWKDVTKIELEEEQAKQEEQILKEQALSNLLHGKQFLEALGLAISLGRPHTVLTVVKAILKETDGKEDLEKNIIKLRKDQKEALLKFSVTWNTNSRNCHEAQAVVETLLRHETPESLLQYDGIKAAVESLLPYTERHFQRLGRLQQASMFLDFMWQNMRLADGSKWDEEMET